MPDTGTAPKRPRHLMDPDNLVRTPATSASRASLTRVQQWVFSVLAVFTIAHLAVGLVIAGVMASPNVPSARIGLCVIAGLFGMVGVATGQLIHKRNPFNAWLLIGILPTVVGIWLVLR